MRPSSKTFLLTVPRRYIFCGSFVLVMPCVCYAFASVHCCLVVTIWERVDLLALVCDVHCVLPLSHVVSLVRCGTCLYRFLVFANFLTGQFMQTFCLHAKETCLALLLYVFLHTTSRAYWCTCVLNISSVYRLRTDSAITISCLHLGILPVY